MATFKIGNQQNLQKAVNKSISKKKKEDEAKKAAKQASAKKIEVATRKAQQPINKITTSPSSLNKKQVASNLETARNIVQKNKQAISQFKESKGITQNKFQEMRRDTELRKPTNSKMTPISKDRNAWEAGPQNASQILYNKVEKEKEVMDTDKGQELLTNLRQSQNVAAYENYNANQKELENYKGGGFLDNTVGSLIRGVSSLFDNMDEENFVYDDKGNRRKLASYSEMKQQKNQQNQGFVGKIVSSTFNNLGKVLGATAIDTATFGVGGKAIYWGDIYFDTYNQNLNEGYDEGSAASSAMLTTAMGAVIDKLLGSASVNTVGRKMASIEGEAQMKTLEDVFAKALTNKGLNKTLTKYISSMGSEGLSEFVEEYADAYINKITLDKSTDPGEYLGLILETFPAAFEAGLVGAASGAIGSTTEKIQTGRYIKALKKERDSLVNYTPVTPQEAILKDDRINDIDNQLSELSSKYESGDVKRKQTNTQMEEEATKALEEQKNKNQTAPNTTEQVTVENKEQVEEIKQDSKEVINKQENITKSTENKQETNIEEKDSYPNAQSIQKEKGYTVYYSVPSEDIINRGSKTADNITQQELNDGKFNLITYNQDNTRNIYEFDNKTELNRYIKSIGGYSAFEGKYSIMSNTKEGDFYYVRNKSSQGGWVWKDVNGNLVKGWSDKSKIKETRESVTKYNIPETKEADKIVAKITENSTPEQKEKVDQVLTNNPPKNKTVTKFDDGTSLITPSESIREGGVESASKYMKDSVSEQQVKEIKRQNKERRKSYDNLEKLYESQGNTEMVEYIKKLKENDLYTVEHSSYNIFNEQVKLLEDPENYYKEYSEKVKKVDSKNVDELKKLQYEQIAMLRYFGDMDSPGYNPTIAADISVSFAQEGTDIAQAMVTRKQMYNDSPQQVAIRTQQTLNSMFREEAKEHQGDVEWINRNDPLKNPDSPYKMSDTQFATVNYYANKLDGIEDKTSTEYLTTYGQLYNYIQSLFANDKLTGKLKKLTITNVLASTRIWTQNFKGNLVNLAQFNGIDKLIASNVDKIIAMGTPFTKGSGMRTLGMSFEGDVIQGIKAFKQGVDDSFYELKHDISISKFKSKFTDEISKDVSKLGTKGFGKTFDDNTKVGKLLNDYQRFVNFALDMGDRPFANMYYEQSIYNQRMLNAQLVAQKEGTNIIYNSNLDEKNGTYKVSYFDKEGKKISTIMNEKQYNSFSKEAKIQEITETMCKIAEKEALAKTYQDDNKITMAALKMKESLNEVFKIGDYGFGDMILKFTRTGSNMAKAVYEHSPLEAIRLSKDIAALKRNKKAGTLTAEMQHKVADEAGKLLGGTITMAIIGALNWSGIVKIEGEHDDKKGDKFKELAKGSQEFSFKLPGENYTYKISNDSTIGSLMRLGITGEQLYKETNSLLDTIFAMTDPFANTIIDNSFMSTILDLGNTYSSPLDNLKRKIAAQPSNLIPSMMKDVSFTLDNFTERNTYDENLGQYMLNQIINKTPFRGMDFDKNTPIGHLKGLSAKTTPWGEIKTVGGDFLASVWNTWLTGDTLSKVKNDKISNEIMDIYLNTNNTDAIPNLTNTKKFSYNKKGFELSEKEQNKYMTVYGKTSYKAVKDLMKTNQYKNATDEQKVKLLSKAYDYAKETAMKSYLEKQGVPYNNYKKKDGKYTQYKKSVFEEIIENDISIEEATYKRNNNNPYKLRIAITDFDNYQEISKTIKEIKKAYKNEDYKVQKYVVQTYINELEGMTSVQKAMLAKKEHSKSDYPSYDDKILSYIKSLDLTDEEYQYMYKELGLGGYWSMYYKDKTKKSKRKR